MEPILIYGHPAGSSLGLVAALEWLGSPYRLCRVDMLGEMREPAYARLNPRVETPVLVTDEGRVAHRDHGHRRMARSAGRRSAHQLRPALGEADRMHQVMGFVNTGFTGAFSPLWMALEMAPPEPSFQAALRRFGRQAVIERHDRLEEMVGEGPFLLGSRPRWPTGYSPAWRAGWSIHEVAKIDRWPRLAAMRRRLEADPAVVFATALESGKAASGSGALQGHMPLDAVIARFGR